MDTFHNCVSRQVLSWVCEHMKYHTADYISPVCKVISYEEGELTGTGTFLSLHGARYLVTNEHVARTRLTNSLSMFAGDDDRNVYRIINPFMCNTYPTDIGITRIDWDVSIQINRDALPQGRIDKCWSPIDGEILFIHGYPGVNSRFSGIAGGLLTRTLPFAVSVCALPPMPDKYDVTTHFAINYPMNVTLTDINGMPRDLPDPHGLSGTFVWDTKYVKRHLQSLEWCPHDSKPCGVIFAWEPSYHCLVGTRIEYVRQFIVHALRQECAYFHWLNRGAPNGDDMTDWVLAETNIQDI